MSGPVSTQRAVLFADIVASTNLFALVGDVEARRLVADCLDRWTAIVEGNNGEVVQLRGDGMLSVFPDPQSAVLAARTIRDNQIARPLSMHAGIHVGSILQEGEQLYGDVVNTAARVAEIAKSGEILVTHQTMALLSEDLQQAGRLLKKVPIKNKQPMNLYLIPEHEPVTEYVPPATVGFVHLTLQLRYINETRLITEAKPEFVIGRVDDCDLVVDHSLVSRNHAIIECARGKFFLRDQSTNGTYVRDHGRGGDVVLRREMVQLKGKGVISLGMNTSNDAEHFIEFEEIGASD